MKVNVQTQGELNNINKMRERIGHVRRHVRTYTSNVEIIGAM